MGDYSFKHFFNFWVCCHDFSPNFIELLPTIYLFL
jgi:hypothetical protein